MMAFLSSQASLLGHHALPLGAHKAPILQWVHHSSHWQGLAGFSRPRGQARCPKFGNGFTGLWRSVSKSRKPTKGFGVLHQLSKLQRHMSSSGSRAACKTFTAHRRAAENAWKSLQFYSTCVEGPMLAGRSIYMSAGTHRWADSEVQLQAWLSFSDLFSPCLKC